MKRSSRSYTRREFLRLGSAGAALTLLSTGRPLPAFADRPEPMLDVKIGQMILSGFRGLKLQHNNPIVADFEDRYLGGVVLFDYDQLNAEYVRNIESPKQLEKLDEKLTEAASVPHLLISIDQEGGKVNRLKPDYGFPPSYTQQYLGELNDLEFTHECGETTARTLKSVGINLNLAPVVDVNVNPNCPAIGVHGRSFSADPDIVTAHALQVIEAHHELKRLTTLKHFPGHGSSTEDSHLGITDVTNTWSEMELEPFANIIAAGKADVVMTAHIFNANLDPVYPATLSHATITGILREQLGWDGVVITDDMGMGAITQYYGFEEAVRLSIEAGADILAYALQKPAFDPTIPARAMAEIKRLVEDGAISEARIDESYQRIMRLKARL